MIVVDLETSGLDERIHSILSVGAVEFENPNNKFYGECRRRYGAEVDPEALAKNGFTPDYIAGIEKSCYGLLVDFRKWALRINDRTLGGMVPSFDAGFLRSHFDIYGMTWIFGRRFVDLHTAFYLYLIRTGKEIPLKDGILRGNLDFILEYLKIPGRKTEHHNALEDAQLTATAFYALIDKPIPEQ